MNLKKLLKEFREECGNFFGRRMYDGSYNIDVAHVEALMEQQDRLGATNPIEAKLLESLPCDKGQLDQYSPTWIFIRNWLEIELQKARETNDYLKNDETRTAALRGRIKLLKKILGLSNKEGR